MPEPEQTLGAVVQQVCGEECRTALLLARVIREECLQAQEYLESAVEFLPRPRRPGLSLVAPWLRLKPAKIAPFFTGVDISLVPSKRPTQPNRPEWGTPLETK